MNQKRNIMSLSKINILCLSILLSIAVKGQVINHVVTAASLGSANSLDVLLLTAMTENANTSNPNPDITIFLDAPSLVQISSHLPVVTLTRPGKLKILTNSDPSFPSNVPKYNPGVTQGIDMNAYALLPQNCPGLCNWWSPMYGLAISNCVSGSLVKVNGIKFNNFNKVMNSYMTGPGAAYPSMVAAWGYCAGGPPCLVADNSDQVEISNCNFYNHLEGIRYNKVADMKILYNDFSTDVSYGSVCGAGSAYPILYLDNTTNSVVYKSEIAYNNMIGTADYEGVGITLDPYLFNNPSVDQSLLNVDAKLEFNIHNNTVKNCARGFEQMCMLPNRTTPDASYKISLVSNTFENPISNVALGAPYKHFTVSGNTFKLRNSIPSSLGGGVPANGNYPYYLALGSYSLHTFSGNAGPNIVMVPYNNAFGLDMVYAGNTLGLGVKNNNSFIYTNNTNPVYSWDPSIYIIGDFGTSANFSTSGLNFVNMNLNTTFQVISGKWTNIRETKFSFNGKYNGFATLYDNPIGLYSLCSSISSPQTYVYGNNNISAPTLKSASVKNNVLKVSLDLTGPQIIPANGNYVLEFFKSNPKGELTTLINKQTVMTLTGNTYLFTIVPLSGVTLAPGDRIGVTLTSLGNSNNPTNPSPLGTSSVSYIYTQPPCSDCVSDFAPIPGKDYLISCWVRANVPYATTFSDWSSLTIKFTAYSSTSPLTVMGSPTVLSPSGPLIDNWQKIEGKVSVPLNAAAVKVEFDRPYYYTEWYVDDVRFQPIDASVKTYAYDPETLRLMAELDEQNYATLYEYDEEGKLVRVKKETERGVMTIKESRNSKPVK